MHMTTVQQVIPLDDIDRSILMELQRDGRVAIADLAPRVGLSSSACLRRVRRLEDDDVIDRYVMLVNRAAIGRPTTVVVEVSLSSEGIDALEQFEEAVVVCPGVMSCHLMAGDADYLVHVACAGVEDYERIHRVLAALPGVARLRSSFVIREVCNTTVHDLGQRS